MISIPAAEKAIGMLSLMKFFPGDDEFRGALMELLGEMCSTDEEVLWLARRMRNLYKEWPGAQELRAAFCSKFKPRDGIDASSAIYFDGIPSEKESLMLLPGKPSLAIVGGVAASSDPEAEQHVMKLTEARTMPPVKQFRTITESEARVDSKLRQMYGLKDGE